MSGEPLEYFLLKDNCGRSLPKIVNIGIGPTFAEGVGEIQGP